MGDLDQSLQDDVEQVAAKENDAVAGRTDVEEENRIAVSANDVVRVVALANGGAVRNSGVVLVDVLPRLAAKVRR